MNKAEFHLSLFCKNTRYLRQKNNMSQEDVSKAYQCCKSTLSKYESEKAKRLDAEILLRASSLWKCSPETLVCIDLKKAEEKGESIPCQK